MQTRKGLNGKQTAQTYYTTCKKYTEDTTHKMNRFYQSDPELYSVTCSDCHTVYVASNCMHQCDTSVQRIHTVQTLSLYGFVISLCDVCPRRPVSTDPARRSLRSSVNCNLLILCTRTTGCGLCNIEFAVSGRRC